MLRTGTYILKNQKLMFLFARNHVLWQGRSTRSNTGRADMILAVVIVKYAIEVSFSSWRSGGGDCKPPIYFETLRTINACH